MTPMTSCRWIMTLSLVSTGLIVTTPGSSPSGDSSMGGSGSIGSSSGRSPGTSKPGPSRGSHDRTTRSTGPSGRSNQAQNQAPPERMQALEDRLREGHMDQPIAQGQISDRLDQFYRGSEHVAGDTAAGPSSR